MSTKAIPVLIDEQDTPIRKSTQISAHELYIQANHAHQAMKKVAAPHLREHKLSLVAWLLLGLAAAEKEDGISAKTASKLLGVSPAQITSVSQTLIQRHVLRQKTQRSDRRSRHLIVTARGRTLLTNVEAAIGQSLTDWLRPVPDNYLAFYRRVLDAMSTMAVEAPQAETKPSVIK